jgi:hypothetical protein
MQPIWPSIAALVVGAIFYVWRAYEQVRVRRARSVRQRVAYMLWVMATQSHAETHEIRRVTV